MRKLKNIPADNIEITQWQQGLVTDRMRTAIPEDYIPWEEAKKIIAKI